MTAVTFERNIRKGSFKHDRKDKWWLFPLVSGTLIIIFVIYTTLVLFLGVDSFKFGNYVSPIFGFELPESFLNQINWPSVLTPAWLLIWAPIGFRATCYYERKVYYRDFFGNPPACAVDGPDIRRGKYTGERWLPFILNNFHRYFFYAVLLLTFIQVLDFLIPLQYGIGIGNVILFINAILLSLYVVSCHAFRHLIGGGSNCTSCSSVNTVQYKGWMLISRINKRHGTWFWLSLGSVMLADFYIRLLNWGIVEDIVFLSF